LLKVQRALGMTFIIVTHDQEEAMTVADRIAVLDKGRLIQVASPRELYEKPNSRWVASFVGDVNLLEGQVVSIQSGALTLKTLEAGTIVALTSNELVPGMTITIAIRPEKIRISGDAASGAAANALRGELIETGYLGGVSVFTVKVTFGATLKITRANVDATALRIGQRVSLSIAPEACIVLEK
jgi:putrescine transport system ATP-binding protein